MGTKTKQILLPLLAAMIWGSAFVAQKSGSEHLGALTFTWTRYLLAAVAIACFLLVRWKNGGKKPFSEQKGVLLRGGLTMGTVLMIASNLQQYGVGLVNVLRCLIACHLHHRGYHFRVGHVHLASVCFYQ